MLERVEFENFKALRKASLPLCPLTVLVGPNGSGKTTAIGAMRAAQKGERLRIQETLSAGLDPRSSAIVVRMIFDSQADRGPVVLNVEWNGGTSKPEVKSTWGPKPAPESVIDSAKAWLSGLRTFSLNHEQIAQPATVQHGMQLESSGANLAAVLDQLRDHSPERFDALNADLERWIPEYDRILFHTPSNGAKSVRLRTREGQHEIPATALSQGTLFAVAMLTLAHLPSPPTIVCIEEPDRGIHPRLLRDVRDALRRLAYPQEIGESRKPVQVIVTTHSPLMLDLFRDQPEEVVIAEKSGLDVSFHRLSDRADLDDILRDTNLGDLWYSGVLGGVPTTP